MPSKKSTAGIYIISNRVNGHCYIGSAVNLRRRQYEHFRDLRRGKHINRHLQHAFHAYGPGNFAFHILEDITDNSTLISREQYYINILEPEYNIARIAGSCLGMKHSLEARAKVAESNRRRIVTEEWRRNLSNALKGKEFSEETRRKISEAKRGKPLSEKNRAALEIVRQTEDYHRKLSAWQIGRKLSIEHRRKLSEKWKTRPADSIETRQKKSDALRKRWQEKSLSEEERQQLSERSKAAWDQKTEEEKAQVKQFLKDIRPNPTEEQRRKMSESHKERWEKREITEEYRQGLSERTRSYWANLSEEEKIKRRKTLSDAAKKRYQRQKEVKAERQLIKLMPPEIGANINLDIHNIKQLSLFE